jgi:hypothetical protein
LRSLNFNGELTAVPVSDPYTPTVQSFGSGAPVDGFYSPELRVEFGVGLLDLHAMDDSELLSEVFIHILPTKWPCISAKAISTSCSFYLFFLKLEMIYCIATSSSFEHINFMFFSIF